MTALRASSALVIAVATVALACSGAAAQSKSPHADGGQPPASHKAKTGRADAGSPMKQGRASGTPEAAEARNEVAAPKFSRDTCREDQECAPVAMCHSDRCVSAAHAGAMSPEVMCSMECRGGTVDCGFNHCACVASPRGKKLCALVPGPTEGR